MLASRVPLVNYFMFFFFFGRGGIKGRIFIIHNWTGYPSSEGVQTLGIILHISGMTGMFHNVHAESYQKERKRELPALITGS